MAYENKTQSTDPAFSRGQKSDKPDKPKMPDASADINGTVESRGPAIPQVQRFEELPEAKRRAREHDRQIEELDARVREEHKTEKMTQHFGDNLAAFGNRRRHK
jgi:hypothetical protein